MKRHTTRLFILCGFILAMTVAAQAQAGYRINVHVPFDFVVGKKTLPAGDYTVKQIGSGNSLLVQSADGRTAQIIGTNQTTAARESETARLDFRRYGDKYFLATVWTPGRSEGREVQSTPLERFVRHEYATRADQSQPEIVSLNAELK
ncbi:MAG TPA: hypothetical protein VF546_15120 [Pyrinomonadaceae bacterium]|jgi:hypothetical protein